jgi:NADH-ubiquinone oxidoreductase chain 5
MPQAQKAKRGARVRAARGPCQWAGNHIRFERAQICFFESKKKNKKKKKMYLLIPFLPLLAFFVASVFGRYIGRKGSTIITTTCIFATAVLSTVAFYEVALTETNCYVQVATWIDSAILHASWGFLFDSLTVIMLIVVTYVSAVVHLYAIGYMAHDPHIQRFMSYLSLFTFFMIILVTADNFIQMFIGWEGVGLASFLLINF